jgi:tetratricopeptide (TPR) repeat protein
MKMQLDTRSRQAFELVTDALRQVDSYRRSREYRSLEVAKVALNHAKRLDPAYLRAVYYNAIVSDLLGRPHEAIEDFQRVLAEKPPFAEEVRYNLAVAHYHGYDSASLEQAAEYFRRVIRDSNQPELRLLARAVLEQTYAMRMIPKHPLEPNASQIQEQFGLCTEGYNAAMSELSSLANMDEDAGREVKWTLYNARGMSLMYHSDYFGEESEKIDEVSEALKLLEKADYFSPRNWANYCDLGSAHMRLGHWSRSAGEFEAALRYLQEVIEDLRPNYGFALYEIGRCYRLMGKFRETAAYLGKV